MTYCPCSFLSYLSLLNYFLPSLIFIKYTMWFHVFSFCGTPVTGILHWIVLVGFLQVFYINIEVTWVHSQITLYLSTFSTDTLKQSIPISCLPSIMEYISLSQDYYHQCIFAIIILNKRNILHQWKIRRKMVPGTLIKGTEQHK